MLTTFKCTTNSKKLQYYNIVWHILNMVWYSMVYWSRLQKVRDGNGTIYAGFPSSPGFGVGGDSPISTKRLGALQRLPYADFGLLSKQVWGGSFGFT